MTRVVDFLDHRTLINDLAPLHRLRTQPLGRRSLTRFYFSIPEETSRHLHQITAGRVRIKDCTLFETDTSFARYYE